MSESGEGGMKKRNPENTGVTNLAQFRADRAAEKAKAAAVREEPKLITFSQTNEEIADSISLNDGYAIAQSIVDTYSPEGALERSFLARRNLEPSAENSKELQGALERRKEIVALLPLKDLKVVLALHSRYPDHYFETDLLPVAERFIRIYHDTTTQGE